MAVMDCDLETGIRMAIEMTLPLSVTPRLVAVYGYPNAGKTFLIDRLKQELKSQRFRVGYVSGGESRYQYEGTGIFDYLFNHYGDDISTKGAPAFLDISRYTQQFLGRPIDFNVAIYNPSFHPKPHAQVFTHPQTGATFQYDLIIANPDSKEK